MYFKNVFIKHNKLYINIFINNLIKNSQKRLFVRKSKIEWPLNNGSIMYVELSR